jgi:fatty-acyl-CoA synthase
MDRETSEIIDKEGWFHTGDLGVRDGEGYYRITGRKRNMIIRGGENIYSLEVEKFLLTYPDVVDVRVVGVPSRRLGEEVYAFIKTNNGSICNPQSIREYFQTEISRHHIPRWIKIVEEFAGEKDGNIDRNELRRSAIQGLKLKDDHPLEIIYEH